MRNCRKNFLRVMNRWGLLLISISVLQACVAAQPMPLSEASPTLATDGGPLYLMTTTIKNKWAPSYQPVAVYSIFEKLDSQEAETMRFQVTENDSVDEGSKESGNSFLLRFQLKPGKYRLVGIDLVAGFFPVVGQAFMPIHAEFTVTDGGPYYMGNVFGINRERQDNEFRSGSLIPLIDQAITGFSSGTFDVSVRDQFEQDIPLLKTRFPALKDMAIEKSLITVNIQRAQELWEKG